jgi:hypothetical protein
MIDDCQLRQRFCGEYLELRGLRLTRALASRLWSMDAATSARVLGQLVESAFLQISNGVYLRANLGRRAA